MIFNTKLVDVRGKNLVLLMKELVVLLIKKVEEARHEGVYLLDHR